MIMLCRRVSVFSLLSLPAAAVELNMGKLLDSIRQVEDWDGKDGKAGERGPYQFTRAAWEETTRLPFVMARHETTARAVAAVRVRKIMRQLAQHGWDVEPYEIGLAWNAGLTALWTRRVPQRCYEYAKHVENLYYDK